MKQGIHPEYVVATVVCACGNRFETMSTEEELHVEICAVCHPFYTGKQRLVDTAGRVDRFKRKYGQAGDSDEGESSEDQGGDEEESSAADETPQPAAEAASAEEPEEDAASEEEEGSEPEAAEQS